MKGKNIFQEKETHKYDLAANGVIDDSEGLRKYLSEVGYASFISAGTYQIPYHASYEEITNILKAGPMEQQQQ